MTEITKEFELNLKKFEYIKEKLEKKLEFKSIIYFSLLLILKLTELIVLETFKKLIERWFTEDKKMDETFFVDSFKLKSKKSNKKDKKLDDKKDWKDI